MKLTNKALVFCALFGAAAIGCGGGKSEGPKKVILCGNGELDPGEICDPGIDPPNEGACITECESFGDTCFPTVLEGFPGRCNVQCVQQTIVECGPSDACCPGGCDESLDADCSADALCGNGRLDQGEQCDPNIAPGFPGACECPDNIVGSCSQVVMGGDPSSCSITCDSQPVTQCVANDNCCPAGCDASDDNDCGDVCGDGIVGSTEVCDGDCPTRCSSGDACVSVTLTGSAATCNARCVASPIQSCIDGDGCCAVGCNAGNDSDCTSTCGDGFIDADETCDGNCPASCNDGDACTNDVMSGSPATCDVACSASAITACVNSDGCCPASCTSVNDSDCNAVCGNNIIEANETCDGNCPTSCDDGNACTSDVRSGSPSTCNVTCSNTTISACIDADGCCPLGCDSTNDDDCSTSCGNNIIEAPETCDGNCPVSCDDGNACTTNVRSGTAAQCNVTCSYPTISSCVNNDGCCPSGCTFANDNDCICNPDTCASLGWECGTLADDGCMGGGEFCGACSADEDCINNLCEPNYRVGDACTTDAQCDATVGICLTEVEVGWTNGYCTRQCTFDSDCGGGNHCAPNGFCYRDCASSNDCRSAQYQCYDIDGDSVAECAPFGSGSGDPGDACDGFDDCGGGQQGYCATEFAVPFKDGYCLELCSFDADCPAGSHCLDTGVCVADCVDDNSCRGAGYACYDVDGDATTECFWSGTGAGVVGAACAGIWECAGGRYANCIRDWPQGYCTVDCEAGSPPCPSGSSCFVTADADRLCLDSCQNANQCRTNYTCGNPGDGSSKCIPQ